MTVANAIKKLEKLSGQTVTKNDVNEYSVIYKGHVASFMANGGGDDNERSATCYHLRRVGDKSDAQTDYFAGSFYDNLTQMFKNL